MPAIPAFLEAPKTPICGKGKTTTTGGDENAGKQGPEIRSTRELSAALDKARGDGHTGNIRLPADGKSKTEVLRDAGISTSAANRYDIRSQNG